MTKQSWIFIVLFTLVHSSIAQSGENPLPWNPPAPKYDIAPQFPGGAAAMSKFFRDSIQYPETEKTKKLEGYVSVKFYITRKGKIKKLELVNGVAGGPNLAKEAVRVVNSMPPWIPATKKGKPVEAEYHLSVPFKLN